MICVDKLNKKAAGGGVEPPLSVPEIEKLSVHYFHYVFYSHYEHKVFINQYIMSIISISYLLTAPEMHQYQLVDRQLFSTY